MSLLSQPHSTALLSPKCYDKRYEDRFLSRRELKPQRFMYCEIKRCMLTFLELGSGFSRGCAHPNTRALVSMTHPTTLDWQIGSGWSSPRPTPSIRESTLGDTRLLYSASPGSCWSRILRFEKISSLRRWATNAFQAVCDHTPWLRAGITVRTSKEYDIMVESIPQATKAVVLCSRG